MRPPSHGNGRHHHGSNQAAANHLVSCFLSDWPSKDQHFVVATEPATWSGVQHGVDAPQLLEASVVAVDHKQTQIQTP